MEDLQLFRSLKGQTTPAEETLLRAWRLESPDHERSYHELAVMLDSAQSTDPPLDTQPPSVFKLIHAAESRCLADEAKDAANRKKPARRGFPLAILAVASLVMLFVARDHMPFRAQARTEVHTSEIVTGPSERTMVTLQDGTVIRLGAESRLQVLDGGDARSIRLRGRAFLAVAHSPVRPFVVRTDAGEIEVLGTRFDIAAQDEELRVTVVEGTVSVAGRGGSSQVRAGQMQRVTRGTVLPAIEVPDVTETLRWMGKFLAFQETPLADAAREIEALYDVRIEIADERIARQTLTTWFADEPVEQVLRVFCLVAEAECTTTGELTTVRPKRRQ